MPAAPLVVLTRQPAQAGQLEADLRAAGCTVRFLPLTDFELPADLQALRGAVDGLRVGDFAWLLITSPNSARALVLAGWDGQVPATTQVGVTGPGTARVVAELGGTQNPWMPDGDQSAEGIAAAFPVGQGGRVLLPQSQLASEVVPRGLTAKGWQVLRVEAYRTVPYPAVAERRLMSANAGPLAGDEDVVSLQELEGAVVVLTSPSAVHEVTQRADLMDAAVHWVAIGQPTRRAAEESGLALVGTARTPDAPGILGVMRGRSV